MMGSLALLKARAKNSKNTGLRIAKISQSGDNRTIISHHWAQRFMVYLYSGTVHEIRFKDKDF